MNTFKEVRIVNPNAKIRKTGVDTRYAQIIPPNRYMIFWEHPDQQPTIILEHPRTESLVDGQDCTGGTVYEPINGHESAFKVTDEGLMATCDSCATFVVLQGLAGKLLDHWDKYNFNNNL